MVVIVGAGITGLTLAWRLAREGREVVVLDGADRPGGMMRSLRIDGVLVESGPQALQSNAPATLDLVDALGLRDDIVEADAAAKRRYLLWKGALVELPHGPGGLFTSPLLPWSAPLSLLAEPFRRKRTDPEPETVHDFIARRLGPAFADPLIDAFVAGVFAGDTRALELRSVFPALHEMEQRHGSLIRGAIARERVPRPEWAPKSLFSFRDGLETLALALADALGDRLQLLTRVERIERDGARLAVHTRFERIVADQVVVTAPPWQAAALLPDLADLLGGIPASPIAAVTLGWPADQVPGPLPGFGWLAPTSERRDVLGALQVSRIFPSHAPGRAVVRVMLGGTRDPGVAELDEPALIERARQVLREVQGIEAEPVLAHAALHVPGIPQYVLGHADRVTRLQGAVPGLSFLGWGYTGIGVNQGIASAIAWQALEQDRP